MMFTSKLSARAMNRLGLLKLVRSGYKLTILNQIFKIPIIENKEGFIHHQGVAEPFFLEVLRGLYAVKHFRFLDVGVNFGQTLLKVKAIDPAVEYLGFEPSRLCSYYVSRLIDVNRFVNARIITVALSDVPGILTLQAPSEGDTRATVVQNGDDSSNAYKELVPALTLDSLIPLLGEKKDSILKVDVEAAELMVFKGAENYIRAHRPVTLFENLPSHGCIVKNAEQLAISEFFVSKNYQLFAIDERKKDVVPISGVTNTDDMESTNYMAIPAEQTALTELFAAVSGSNTPVLCQG